MTDERTLRTSEECIQRMEALVRKMASTVLIRYDPRDIDARDLPLGDYREAAAIVAMLPEPVDPDQIEARVIVRKVLGIYGPMCPHDKSADIAIALAALKRGRELAASDA